MARRSTTRSRPSSTNWPAVESQIETSKVLRLHLGVPPLFGGQRLFPRLPELRKLHPRLHIDIDTSPQRIAASATRWTPRSSCQGARPGVPFGAAGPQQGLRDHIARRCSQGRSATVPEFARSCSRQTFLIHHDLPDSFDAWKEAMGLPGLEPAAIDHFDSGQLILEAAARAGHRDHARRPLRRAATSGWPACSISRWKAPIQLLVRLPAQGPGKQAGQAVPQLADRSGALKAPILIPR
jgi:hypothetical protein